MFKISKTWYEILKDLLESAEMKAFFNWLDDEYKTKTIYPKQDLVFNAINHLKPQDVKVVIIGQDPYHQPKQAHGFSFSVQDGVPQPPSLRNIFKEIENSTGVKMSSSGNLTNWVKQGVLLLNSVLTVEESKPNSHKDKGWEKITQEIVRVINRQAKPVVFMLWGSNAKKFLPLINKDYHLVLTANHPSPMSANVGGWFGCNHFNLANEFLARYGKTQIDWKI